jgi:hypothetical protein
LSVKVTLNMAAFVAENLNEEKMLDLSPVADKPFPKMTNVTLEHYLQRFLQRVDEKGPVLSRCAYLVKRDGIEITTVAALRRQIWGDYKGPYLPLVHAQFEKKTLEEALKELAEQSEHNIVIDARVAEKVKTAVTARFLNTPLDTAVSFLADMAELASVLQDNVIYVTTRDNALRLEARQKKDMPDDPEAGVRPRVGSGVRGFVPRMEQAGAGMN